MSYPEPVKTSTKALLGAGLTHRVTRTIISKLCGEENTPSLMAINKWSKELEEDIDPKNVDTYYPRDSYAVQVITSFPFLKFGKVNFAFTVALHRQNRIIAAINSPTGFDGIISAINLAKIYTPVPPEQIVISDKVLPIDPILLEIGGHELLECFACARVIISPELNPHDEDYTKIIKFLYL